MRKRIWCLISLLLVLALAACGNQQQTRKSAAGLQVVTSLRVYQEAAAAVLGKNGTATAIIADANTDPHDFEPTTATGRLVSDADVVINNGLGYDDWLTKLTAAAKPAAQQIHVATDVMHRQDGDNEHVFYDPELMQKLVPKLVAKFAKLDPRHAQSYHENARRYLTSLKPLTKLIKQLHHAGKNKFAAASEPVFDYGLQAAGYTLTNQDFAKSIEDGTDPSPQALTQLRHALRTGKINVFVNNTQSDSPIVRQVVAVAKKAGVRVVNVRETQPNDKTYVEWMLSNYRQLK